MIRLALAIAAAIATISAAGAPAPRQPVEPPPAPAPTAAQPEENDPERQAMRARLERRLEESRRVQERLESALQSLDEGASPSQIRRQFRERPGEARQGRGGPRPGPGGPPERRVRDNQPEDNEPLLRTIQEHAPELAERLRRGLREDPRLARRVLSWLGPRLRELAAERDPALIRLRVSELREGPEIAEATRSLARALLAPAAERSQVETGRERLRAALERQYDLRLEIRRREVELLAERLERLRAEVSRGPDERERTVTGRLDEVVSEIEGHRRPGQRRRPAGESGQPPARGPAAPADQETIDPGGT